MITNGDIMESTNHKYLIIGTGPCGISAVRSFSKNGIEFDCVELHSDLGGQWDIKNPMSTMYQSAHLISSKTVMQYDEFSMKEDTADYPHHSEMKKYFDGYSEKFALKKHIEFNTKVVSTERIANNQWKVVLEKEGKTEERIYKGLVLANGIFSSPNLPKFKGQETFKGEIMHSSQYKAQGVFDGKRVLIIGAGNSGCDIAVDAVHRADKIDMSVRRGYYFVPKYLFGKPADVVGGKIKLPHKIDIAIKKKVLKTFTGDPVQFGFPNPDYELFESHPIVNSLILHHLGHGDLNIMSDADHIEGNTVHFKDGKSGDYDLILCATGYKLDWPFMERKHLNWDGRAPKLFINIFHPQYDDLFVLGMVEATGIGYQGRYDQANLVTQYIKNLEKDPSKINRFIQEKKLNQTDLTNKRNYLQLDRMAFYVDKDTYLNKLRSSIQELSI